MTRRDVTNRPTRQGAEKPGPDRVDHDGSQAMPTRADLIERLRAFRRGIPADFKFDRNEVSAH